jgi:hypothetical protein
MRAFSHLRCTVRSDTSRMATISPNQNPISASAGSALPSSSNASLIWTSSRSSAAFSIASVSSEVISKRPPRFWACRSRCLLHEFRRGLRKTESSGGISHDADILPLHFPLHDRGTPRRNTT